MYPVIFIALHKITPPENDSYIISSEAGDSEIS